MIVKLIIHKSMTEISIWNKEGDRLFYSDLEPDIKTAKELLTIKKAMTGELEQRMFGYFNACWLNKVVQLKKRASGYDW